MKLSDRYVPADHKLPSNPLYLHFQKVIESALRSPGDFDEEKESIDAELYSYELSSSENEFFSDLYVPSNQYDSIDGDIYLRSILGDNFEERVKIGEHEKDMLDFLTSDRRMLILTSPIGWGKTVLLKYVWFYLLGQSDWLKRHVIPIYVSVDHMMNRFAGHENASAIEALCEKELVMPGLTRASRPFVGVTNDDFWSYIERNTRAFADLGIAEQDVRALSSVKEKSELLDERISVLRADARKQREFYYCAVKYISRMRDKTPILIFDNVDPMDQEVHKAMIPWAVRIIEQYKIRVIISMRKVTFNDLQHSGNGNLDAFDFIHVELKPRSIVEYVKRRMSCVMRGAKVPAFTHIMYRQNKLTQSDVEHVLQYFVDILLHPECERAVDYTSYHNLRLINKIVMRYLATGYLEREEDNVVMAILKKTVTDHADYELPVWVFLSSLITDNHRTVFSRVSSGMRILNLYCNSGIGLNDHVIKPHMLNYFMRNRTCTLPALREAYCAVFEKEPERLRVAIDHATLRLLQSHLIESPETHLGTNGDNIGAVHTLERTETGEYFHTTFSNYFEYLAFMKDDVDWRDHLDAIQDCVKVTDRNGRYAEIAKFLTRVFDEEIQFLDSIDSKSRRIHFRNNFSRVENNCVCMTQAPTDLMLSFGQSRKMPIESIKAYQDLLDKIGKYDKGFTPAI